MPASLFASGPTFEEIVVLVVSGAPHAARLVLRRCRRRRCCCSAAIGTASPLPSTTRAGPSLPACLPSFLASASSGSPRPPLSQSRVSFRVSPRRELLGEGRSSPGRGKRMRKKRHFLSPRDHRDVRVEGKKEVLFPFTPMRLSCAAYGGHRTETRSKRARECLLTNIGASLCGLQREEGGERRAESKEPCKFTMTLCF